MIIETYSLGPARTNTYLLGCPQTKSALIIDAPLDGFKIHDKRFKELALQKQMLLLTHSHWDHIVDAGLMKEKWGVPIYIHRQDAGNLSHPGSDQLPLLFSIQGVEPDHYLSDRHTISVGKLQIEVIHTPGHTPGGVCFYLPEYQVLFSGDTLFKGAIGNLSFPTACAALMETSLKRLARLPKQTRVYPGHGDTTTIEAESWIANFKGER